MNNLTKKHSKQLITIFIFTLSIIVLTGIVTTKQMEDSLMSSRLDQITSLKHSLKVNVTDYFDDKENVIKTISKDDGIKDALIDFSSSFKEISKNSNLEFNDKELLYTIEKHLKNISYLIPNSSIKKDIKEYIPLNENGKILQNIYIAQNQHSIGDKYNLIESNIQTKYNNVHKKYHKKFLDILKRHNFYDIFLIDNNGNIVYTVFKELDLGTNLTNGVYKDSSLGSAYKQSIENQSFSFSDFKPYEPSYNEPAAFFSIPIVDQKKTIGAIAFQISIDEINNIMTFNKSWKNIGLGNSGESYLVGQDYLMRSDSRFLNSLNDEIVTKLNRTVGITNVKSKPIKFALNKKESSGIFLDYRDKEVLGSYTFIDIFNNIWALAVEVDISEIENEINQSTKPIIITGIIIIVLATLFILFLLKRFIIEPVDNYESKLEAKVQDRTEKLNYLNKILKEEVNAKVNQIREKDQVLLHQSRMAAIGEMVGNIAHQWRQPLNIISTSISNIKVSIDMQMELTKDTLISTSDIVLEQTNYLSKTIDDFRDFTNNENTRREVFNLKDIIKKSINLVKIGNEDISFILFLEDTKFECNENHMIQVCLTLIKNAVDAINKKKDIEDKYIFITISHNNDNIKIEFKDNGLGIENDIKDKLFDPYTTTKHKYIGTGLGLYISYQTITTLYNGTITSNNVNYEYNGKDFSGAQFIITLPLS